MTAPLTVLTDRCTYTHNGQPCTLPAAWLVSINGCTHRGCWWHTVATEKLADETPGLVALLERIR